MAYFKVISSGSVIEVYEYEKDPIMSDGRKNDEEKYNQYERIILEQDENEWIYERGDRVEERRKQTLREARNLTRRLALMNFSSGSAFVTLTYPDTRHLTFDDIDIADDDFKKFMKRLRYKYDRNFKYLAVREFTKRGRIHFHMLIDYEIQDTRESVIRELEQLWGRTIWKHGFVDIKPLAEIDNVGAYLIKYMTKDVSVEAFKGHKAYLCSKGLERPLELRGDDAKRVIEVYGLENKKEVFTNCYESEYLGTICYKEYNLKRC